MIGKKDLSQHMSPVELAKSVLSCLTEAKLCREQGVPHRAAELEELARAKMRRLIQQMP